MNKHFLFFSGREPVDFEATDEQVSILVFRITTEQCHVKQFR